MRRLTASRVNKAKRGEQNIELPKSYHVSRRLSGYGTITIEKYQNLAGDSGIAAYKIESDAVTVEFIDGATYLYNYASAGREHIEAMKALAKAGRGLSGYISKYVRTNYAAQLR